MEKDQGIGSELRFQADKSARYRAPGISSRRQKQIDALIRELRHRFARVVLESARARRKTLLRNPCP